MKNDNLNIDSTPNLLKKNKFDFGVKKLNKKPIMIISFAAIVVLIGLFYAAMQRSKNNKDRETTRKETEKVDFDTSNIGVEKMVNELRQDKISNETKKVTKYTPKVEQKESVPLQNNTAQTKMNVSSTKGLSDEDKELIRLKKQLELKALTAPSKLSVKTDTKDEYKATNNTNQNNQNPVSHTTKLFEKYLNSNKTEATDKDSKSQKFLNQKFSFDYLGNKKTSLISPYEVKTGTVIPAVLISGANSDLPGKIIAQVRENVYDTATGQFLLIPQGTRLVGEYSANVIYGQNRLLVAWSRLVFPNGATLNLGNMEGMSQDGFTGFHDKVDNHYFRIFGSAFMMSAITAGVSISSGNNGDRNTETNKDKAVGAAIQQLGQVGTEMIRKNMDISPTLEIRPGYRFNIFITKDIILEPLKY